MRVLRSLTFQSDVEQHIGGPDAEVEPVLRSFQDAIAYVPIEPLDSQVKTHFTLKEVPVYGKQPEPTAKRSGGEDP